MDRISANADEYRQSSLKSSTLATSYPAAPGARNRQDDEAIALARSSSNAVDNAFVAFHNARMANAAP